MTTQLPQQQQQQQETTFKYSSILPTIFSAQSEVWNSSEFHEQIRCSPATLSREDENKLYASLPFLLPENIEKYLVRHDQLASKEAVDKIPNKEGYCCVHDKSTAKTLCFNVIEYATAIGNTTLLDFIVSRLEKLANDDDEDGKEGKTKTNKKRSLAEKYFLSGAKAGDTVTQRTTTHYAAIASQVDVLRWLLKNKLLEPLVWRSVESGKKYLPIHFSVLASDLVSFRFFVEELDDDDDDQDEEKQDNKENNEGTVTTTTATTIKKTKRFELTDENPIMYMQNSSANNHETFSIVHYVASTASKTEAEIENQTAFLRYILENSPKGNNKYEKISNSTVTAFARACSSNRAGTLPEGNDDDEEQKQLMIEKYLSPVKTLAEFGLHEANLKEATTIQKLKFNKMSEDELNQVVKAMAISSATAKPLEAEGFSRETHMMFLKFECLPICHESVFGNGTKIPTVPISPHGQKNSNSSGKSGNHNTAEHQDDSSSSSSPVVAIEKRQQQLTAAVLVTLMKQRVRENSPIHIAAAAFNTPLLRFLISEKVGLSIDVNGKTQKSEVTPLIAAVRSCDTPKQLETIKCLVEEGHADVDVSQKDGATPLYVASYFNKMIAARYLLGRKANGSKMFNDRATPFIGAIAAKNLDMIKLLIEMNCDTTTKRLGETPLEYSKKVNGANHPVTLYVAQRA